MLQKTLLKNRTYGTVYKKNLAVKCKLLCEMITKAIQAKKKPQHSNTVHYCVSISRVPRENGTDDPEIIDIQISFQKLIGPEFIVIIVKGNLSVTD